MSTTETLPCISIHRPWALWVREGWKTIETRTHNRFRGLIGKRIAIHASKTWDSNAMAAARKWLTPEMEVATYHQRTTAQGSGEIVAIATVSAFGLLSPIHESRAMIECATTRFGLYLTDIQPFDGPRVRGQQGIFRVEIKALPEQPLKLV